MLQISTTFFQKLHIEEMDVLEEFRDVIVLAIHKVVKLHIHTLSKG